MNFHKESGQGIVEIVLVLFLVTLVFAGMWAMVGSEVIRLVNLPEVQTGVGMFIK